MRWNSHYKLDKAHAFMSPSAYHWVNYDLEKLSNAYYSNEQAKLGTRIHAFAEEAIQLGIRMPNTNTSLNMFVNDAIGFMMSTEQTLYVSPYAFGTADGITFYNDKPRIHDLKTGKSGGNMTQLEIYAAFFCLEYRVDPSNIQIELRIYHNDSITIWEPAGSAIQEIMDVVVRFTKHIEMLEGAESNV